MVGSLVCVDVYGVQDAARLNDHDVVTRLVERACWRGGATVLASHHHSFSPQGLTVVSILAESHAAVHTYPEESAYMVDVFTCGDADPRRIADEIVAELGGSGLYERIDRGRRTLRLAAAE